ncbi:unnamed protein product [Coffea canephora]|uniref:DH200=94 genomic scaffold, scaffold_383 n=1 Tax=Coffea canephora TaxID=49390 RepID=A0A068VFB6_COFCA|nr:unnamed protein product [Coffea canephora]
MMIPLIGLNGYIQTKFMKGFSADAKVKEASQVASDAVRSIRTVASFRAEEKVTDKYEKKCEGRMRVGIRQGLVSGIGLGSSLALFFCEMFYSSKAKGAAASIFAILDRISKMDANDESGMTLESVKGEIELRHVSFKYPRRPNVHIFQDLSLWIQGGKVKLDNLPIVIKTKLFAGDSSSSSFSYGLKY